ncbi:proclotting enzyme-like [Paramacrobiotus metropolitanus]|uniref:proclotting enzyme-like n=1 Tax=Paramacrobiotus metropolitanus TaxID=2943436 RepID=UPI002445FC20|nr:proclotting enzyme-like [Paramacrobiotus metropolitanus]
MMPYLFIAIFVGWVVVLSGTVVGDGFPWMGSGNAVYGPARPVYGNSLYRNETRSYKAFPTAYRLPGINYMDAYANDVDGAYLPANPSPSYSLSEIIGPACLPDAGHGSAYAGFCVASEAAYLCSNMSSSKYSKDCANFRYGDAICCYNAVVPPTSTVAPPTGPPVNNSILREFLHSHSAYVQEMQCGIPNIDPQVFIALEKQSVGRVIRRKRNNFVIPVARPNRPTVSNPLVPPTFPIPFNGQIVAQPKATGRIVGGFDAPNGSASICWQVGVLMRTALGAYRCGGVIIGARTILTAGHCLIGPLNISSAAEFNASAINVTVTIGATTALVSGSEGAETFPGRVEGCARDYHVAVPIPHEEYDFVKENNDVSLLILDEDIDFRLHGECACKLCLNTLEPQPGDICIASGFGLETQIPIDFNGTFPDQPRPETPLKYVPQTIHPMDFCFITPGYNNLTNYDLYICAGGLGENVCFGDSGGPLFCYDRQTRTQYLAGLTSHGWGCAEVGSFYTKVHPVLPWIFNHAPLNDVSVMIHKGKSHKTYD